MWGEHADAGNFMGRVWSVKMHTGPTIRMWLKDIQGVLLKSYPTTLRVRHTVQCVSRDKRPACLLV